MPDSVTATNCCNLDFGDFGVKPKTCVFCPKKNTGIMTILMHRPRFHVEIRVSLTNVYIPKVNTYARMDSYWIQQTSLVYDIWCGTKSSQ